MKTHLRLTLFHSLCLLVITGVLAIAFLRIWYYQPPLPRLKAVPPFQLIERSGRSVTLADLKGKVLLIDFIYSECPGPCPMVTSRLSKLQPELLKDPNVMMVSITLNPARDTSEVLKQYAERFHASPDRWLFLTGEKSSVRDLVVNGFMLTVLDQADPTQPIIHSVKLALVDKNGCIRAYFDANDESNRLAILKAIHQLSRE